jgi:hypothetical protein
MIEHLDVALRSILQEPVGQREVSQQKRKQLSYRFDLFKS